FESRCRNDRHRHAADPAAAVARSATMSRSFIVAAAACAALFAHPAPAPGQDLAVDTTGAAALVDQALSHSAVMGNLQYLTDVIVLYRHPVKGAWVMTRVPSLVWNNDGPPMTAADSARQRDFFRTVFTPFRDADSSTQARMQQFANDVPYLLHRAGALGILVDAGKEHALLNMSGSPNRPLPLPQLAVAHEDFALF